NYIGTDATGMRAAGTNTGIPVGTVGVNYSGIAVGGSDVMIGGTDAGSGNLISGNRGSGILLGFSAAYHISAYADRALVQGNLIGTKADGVGELGNEDAGISFLSASSNCTIGGLDPGAGNVIAFNVGGVIVNGAGNRVLSNSIYSNYGHGIVFYSASSNKGQSSPVITSEDVSDNGTATINGTLHSAPNAQFLVQFFSDSQSLTNPQQTYLGSTNVMTNGNGNGTFSAHFPFSDTDVVFNATATDPNGNTSEFSRNPAFLQNLSARAAVGAGDNALISGLMAQYGNTFLRGIG